MDSIIKNNNCDSFPYLCELTKLLNKISDSKYIDSCFVETHTNTIDWVNNIYDGFKSKTSYSNLYYKPLVIIVVTVYGHATILLIIDRKTYGFGLNVEKNISLKSVDVIDPFYENYGSIPSIKTEKIIQDHNKIVSPDWDPYKIKSGAIASSNAIIRNIFPLNESHLTNILIYLKTRTNSIRHNFKQLITGYWMSADIDTITILLNDSYDKYCIDGTNCATFVEQIFPDELHKSYVVSIPTRLSAKKHTYADMNIFIKSIIDDEVIDYGYIGGRKHKSRKHKSRKHKSRKHKSRKHK